MSSETRVLKYIVVPYRQVSNGIAPAEIRPASSEFGAARMAESMSSQFAGVAAYEVLVDTDSGDMGSPRILAQFGIIPELEEA